MSKIKPYDLSSIKPSQEQQQAIEKALRLQCNQIMLMEAYAGGAKTTTLILIAKAFKEKYPDSRIIYLAFNSMIKDEAKIKFSGLATVMTLHGYALNAIEGWKRLNKGRRKLSLTIAGVADAFEPGGKRDKPNSYYQLVSDAISTVKRYLQSDSLYIGFKHLVCLGESGRTFFKDNFFSDRLVEHFNSDLVSHQEKSFYADTVMEMAHKVYLNATSEDPRYPTSHDSYLKDFQTRKALIPYDLILFDERQDANRCMLSIMENQSQSRVIMVGDQNQSIYGFRGGCAPLKKEPAIKHTLSISYRFGPAIANLAMSALLQIPSSDCHHTPIIGAAIPRDPAGNRILPWNAPSPFVTIDELVTPFLHLVRTNGGALQAAIRAISRSHYIAKSSASNDTIKNAIWLLKSAVYMSLGHEYIPAEGDEPALAFHSEIAIFDCWHDLLIEIQKNPEAPLRWLVYQVDQKQREALDIVATIKSSVAKSPHQNALAEIITTVHKAKGIESIRTAINDEFCIPKPTNETDHPLTHFRRNPESIRLLYVAITRAKQQLALPESVLTLSSFDPFTRYEKAMVRMQQYPHIEQVFGLLFPATD